MQTMSNRELLELAAKAGGIKGEYVSWCYNGFKEGIREPNDKSSIPWNPLTGDGDALRLAVKLGLCMTIDLDLGRETEVWDYGALAGAWEAESHNQDPYAATRRAIVRVAAEIGKAST